MMMARVPLSIRSPALPIPVLRQSLHCSSSPNPNHNQTLTPLFLRPLSHSTTTTKLSSFHHWAQTLARSSFPNPDDAGVDSSHLLRELSWLLQDTTSTSSDTDTVRLRAHIDDLYSLWRQRVEERKPFQYLVGNEHWRDLVLVVREGVLIPRPETELLVDLAREVDGFREGLWADMGTGSGAIAVGIGRELGTGGSVIATDVSGTAVEVARFNIERYGLKDKVEIRQGSWFDPLQDVKGRLTGLISNPPYIPSSHISGLQAEVGRHEPRLALDGGENGMEHLVHLCEGSASALKAGGFFAFETNGDEQTEFIADLMKTKWGDFFCNIKRVPDFAGIKRFLTGYRI